MCVGRFKSTRPSDVVVFEVCVSGLQLPHVVPHDLVVLLHLQNVSLVPVYVVLPRPHLLVHVQHH